MSIPAGVDVQHWVLSRLIRQHGAREVFDLHEVAFALTVPGAKEFPLILPRFDLLLRVAATDAGPTRMRVRVHHQRPTGRWHLRHDLQDPRFVLSFPEAGRVVQDQPVRLPHVRLEGPGLHAITVYFRSDSDDESDLPLWNPNTTPWDPDDPGWEFGAVEYVHVVRET